MKHNHFGEMNMTNGSCPACTPNSVLQAAFDKSTAALLAQGAKSFGEVPNVGSACLYRGPEGRKCAIGHLMSDEQIAFFEIKEDTNVWTFPSGLLNQLLPEVDEAIGAKFLSELQRAHDRASPSTFVADFTRVANEVASCYNLTPIKET